MRKAFGGFTSAAIAKQFAGRTLHALIRTKLFNVNRVI